MTANDFFFRDKKLSDFNMMICAFDEDADEGKGVEFVTNAQKAPLQKRWNRVGSISHDSPLTIYIQVCKRNCFTDDPYLSVKQVEMVTRWLTAKDVDAKLKMIQTDAFDYYYLGTFTKVEYLKANGKIYGMNLTFTSNAPFALREQIVLEKRLYANEEWEIYDVSTETGWLYPDLFIIEVQADGDLEITNLFGSGNEKTVILNCTFGEQIRLDGKHMTISSSEEHHGLPNHFNYIFPKIQNTYYDSRNVFIANLPCTIRIAYSPQCSLGVI